MIANPQVIDLSSNNHPGGVPIDWPAVKASGQVQAVIVKASQGQSYQNPWYAADVAGARGVGLPTIAYHFAAFTDAAIEAAWFETVAGELARAGDFETSAAATWMRTFLNALPAPALERLAYGSAATLPGGLPALSWVADWSATSPPTGATLWQRTGSGSVPGVPGPVDLSTWLGSLSTFEAVFGVEPAQRKGTTMQADFDSTGRRRFSYIDSPGGVPNGQIIELVETAPGANQYNWFAVSGSVVNLAPGTTTPLAS